MTATITEYLEAIPASRSDRFNKLHRLILDLYPDAMIDMKYKMPTYTVGEGWVALANQKSYISLYTCGYHHIESFKQKHPKIKTGKGCINFRDSDELHTEDISQVIHHAIKHPKLTD